MRLAGGMFQMALRIVDQFRESQLLFLGEIIPKGLLDLCLDDTGTASQHMDECLMFSVKIREEVFRSLGHAAEGKNKKMFQKDIRSS